MDNKKEETLEKINEIGYIRLNFQNKLRVLSFRQDQIIKKIISKSDNYNLKKIREGIK